MSMTARLYTISGLSVELNRDRRTLGKALARVPPDGRTEAGDPGWFLTTALRALGRNNGREQGDYVDDGAINALEAASEAVDRLLEDLRAQPSVKKRREMLKRQGRAIGELTVALDRIRAGHSDATRMVEGPFVDGMVGAVIGEVMHLCNLEIKAA
jgi:hypothetical protein